MVMVGRQLHSVLARLKKTVLLLAELNDLTYLSPRLLRHGFLFPSSTGQTEVVGIGPDVCRTNETADKTVHENYEDQRRKHLTLWVVLFKDDATTGRSLSADPGRALSELCRQKLDEVRGHITSAISATDVHTMPVHTLCNNRRM